MAFGFDTQPIQQTLAPAPASYPAPAYTPRYANTGGSTPIYTGAGTAAAASIPPAPGAFPSAAQPVTPQDSPYWWMMSIPDVAPIINQAVANGNDADWIKSHIEQTQWWQTNSESARNWLQLQKQDPATASQQLLQKQNDIFRLAEQLGLSQDTNIDWAGMAQRAITESWNQQQIMDALGPLAWTTGGTGTLQQALQQMKAIAKSYGVPVSDQALQWYADAAVFQNQGIDSFKVYAANAAKSLYPAAAQAIDSGQTLDQFFDPYKQIAAKDLEISPDSIDLSDPKWNKAINSVNPQNGQKYAMSLGDFETMIKTNPVYNYDSTLGARQEAATLAQSMLQAFGR